MRYININVAPIKEEAKRKRRKRLVFFSLALVLAVFVGFVGYVFYWPISGLIGQLLKDPGVVLSFFTQGGTELKSTNGKTNFLLLGIDKRTNVPYTFLGPAGKQERNGFLADTIILASVDSSTKQVSLVSIPRDTWVSI